MRIIHVNVAPASKNDPDNVFRDFGGALGPFIAIVAVASVVKLFTRWRARWSPAKVAILCALVLTPIMTWQSASREQTLATAFDDPKVQAAMKQHAVRLRAIVQSHYPAMSNPDLELIDEKTVTGLTRAQAAIENALNAVGDLRQHQTDLFTAALSQDRPAFTTELTRAGLDSGAADQVAYRADMLILPPALRTATTSTASVTDLMSAELEYTRWMLAHQGDWHVAADGVLEFKVAAEVGQYQALIAKVRSALKPIAAMAQQNEQYLTKVFDLTPAQAKR